ncbi:MAG: CDP-glucose 4,6-dehydratase [Verrucomicrobia bacterium]|nr:CDP-glucose 4,6-dehydratase [Verrucomicrobiota bacterium]
MDKTFWKGKKVLITGHTGFKGSWLSLWLQRMEADVTGYALPPPTKPSLFEIAHVADGMRSMTGDVCNLEHLKGVMGEYRPEIIFHMAAQPIVRDSYMQPVETYATNVMGTVNVLEAARHADDVRAIICITSDKCYENREWFWGYRESDRLGGRDPYSSSKACAELVISAYRDSYFPVETYERHGVAVASTRAGNVIGGGDWARDRLIPDVVNGLMDARPVIIRNPNAVRPWQFVIDPLNGYLRLAERLWAEGPGFSKSWNFGPNHDEVKPVLWIVEYLTKLWGEGACWELDVTHKPHEDNYLKLDCSNANNILRWSPKVGLPTALEWIAEWYQGYQRNEDMRDLTEVQITRYENMAT